MKYEKLVEITEDDRKEQYRKLIKQLADEMDGERWLRNSLVFMAALQDKRVVYDADGFYKLESKTEGRA